MVTVNNGQISLPDTPTPMSRHGASLTDAREGRHITREGRKIINSPHYLNGIDWVMAGLDALNKQAVGIGNHSQIVIEVSGRMERNHLFSRLKCVLAEGALCTGESKRAWHLAPYWKRKAIGFFSEDIHVEALNSPDDTQYNLIQLLRKRCRSPFPNACVMLAFDLIYFRTQTFLLCRFDHKFLDARGAEALLNALLCCKERPWQDHLPQQCLKTLEGRGRIDSIQDTPDFPSDGPRLDKWRERFHSGKIINRFLRSAYPENGSAASFSIAQSHRNSIALIEERTPSAFFFSKSFLKKRTRRPTLHHTVVPFTKEETRRVDVHTMQKAGYLMGGIYLLACTAAVLDGWFSDRKCPGKMVVPVNVDTRGVKLSQTDIFFNHVSFLQFCIERQMDKKQIIVDLKKQFMEQIREEIPEHFKSAALLMRIAPLRILGEGMGRLMRKKPYSFSFSYVGEQGFHNNRIFDHPVKGLFHMPVVPVEPGVGVYFTRFNGTLTLVISAFDHKIANRDAALLADSIQHNVLYG